MMILIVIVGLLVLVAAVVGLWFVATQRELVNMEEKCNNALSQIEVQMNSRWDALMQLAKAASSYSKYEGETLQKTIEARRGAMQSVTDVNQQQSAFNELLGRLMALHEAYPDLKASALYEKAMNAITGYEDNVRMARMIYNDTATRMNRYVRQWPSSFVAGMLHFGLKEYLSIDNDQKKNMPDVF